MRLGDRIWNALWSLLSPFVVLLVFASWCRAAHTQVTHVSTSYEQPIANANYPELVYWFVTPETFRPGRVEQDIRHIAHDTFFTFPFLTERNGTILFNYPRPNDFTPPSCPKWPPWCGPFRSNDQSHRLVAEIVRDAHRHGLRIGMAFDWMLVDTRQRIPFDE